MAEKRLTFFVLSACTAVVHCMVTSVDWRFILRANGDSVQICT